VCHVSRGLTTASLKETSRACRILWKQTPTSEPFELAARYPLELLCAFSSYCRDRVDESAPDRPKIFLVGGNVNAIRTLLRWILSCCHGAPAVPEIGHRFAIFDTCKLVQMCTMLQMPKKMVQAAQKKALSLVNVMPTDEDVKAVFDEANFDTTHIARSIAVIAVANAIVYDRASPSDTPMALLYAGNQAFAQKLEAAVGVACAERIRQEEGDRKETEEREEMRKGVDEAFEIDVRAVEWMRRIEEIALQARRARQAEG
jgi:hypothetical protein